MVGRVDVASLYGYCLEVATIQHMVDFEEKTVVVVCDCRAVGTVVISVVHVVATHRAVAV